MALDRQGWVTVIAAVLLALITLFTSYDHVELFRALTVDLPQQAGVPCIAAALATAVAEAQLATGRRLESEAIRNRAEAAADEERRRADAERRRAIEEARRTARRARRQARCDCLQLQVQLEPNATHIRRARDMIALLEEYGDID
ncbi:hypothetical protein [Synechococcus sp. RS9909]|uniref:hypothetical protein n=1 Tax=Synechococcus sp. RS9909 TaxID=221352 RepID=UPI00164923E0|nr:hypothetical protein [Synechococcus sp. RS9909]